MRKSFLVIAAILGALSVGLGAFGAHGLKKIASQEMVEVYQTAVRYQFYHVFALMAVGILLRWYKKSILFFSGLSFMVGILLFCGSLYLITFMETAGHTISPAVGIITPLGGVFLILGWILLAVGLTKKKPHSGSNGKKEEATSV